MEGKRGKILARRAIYVIVAYVIVFFCPSSFNQNWFMFKIGSVLTIHLMFIRAFTLSPILAPAYLISGLRGNRVRPGYQAQAQQSRDHSVSRDRRGHAAWRAVHKLLFSPGRSIYTAKAFGVLVAGSKSDVYVVGCYGDIRPHRDIQHPPFEPRAAPKEENAPDE